MTHAISSLGKEPWLSALNTRRALGLQLQAYRGLNSSGRICVADVLGAPLRENPSPGARWSHVGTLEEIHGLARVATTSSFEVVGKGPLATPAGTFTAIHVTELRWQAGSRYRIERWIDELALVPLREEWRAAEARPAFVHGIGSFSMFDPPSRKAQSRSASSRARADHEG